MNHPFKILGLAFIIASATPALAQTLADTLAVLKQQASQTGGFAGFSAARGEQFFKATHVNDWSCATCHTKDPTTKGKHTKTGKILQPLAPAANPDRFTDQAKIDKWFRRNCKDVLDRECTPLEKGDVLTYLMSLK